MGQPQSLQRIEAFSDGVFAIAITLLVLEIKVPEIEEPQEKNALLQQLFSLWPSFTAFVISFGSILVMWANHHRVMKMLDKVSNAFIFANGFLLMCITFVPFPTAVLARYIATDQANIGVMFYSFSFLLANVGFNIWWIAMRKPKYLLVDEVTDEMRTTITRQTVSGLFVYITTTIIAYWFPTVALISLYALFFLWVGMEFIDREKKLQ